VKYIPKLDLTRLLLKMAATAHQSLLPAYRILDPRSQIWSGKCNRLQGSGLLLASGRCQREQSVLTRHPCPGTRWWRAGLCSQYSLQDTYSGWWERNHVRMR
jgi:hypothetical protein